MSKQALPVVDLQALACCPPIAASLWYRVKAEAFRQLGLLLDIPARPAVEAGA
ncbi:hypothetical protein ABT214_13145 [Micromonospora purpureochromogenes]|uniref:hypothetical protein n=1 Tax=Micromonospora purpureochromogenes TaxID=47872 RepID=UPI003333B188